MRLMRLAMLALTLLLVTGCSHTNIAELMKAMGDNPATVCVTATYGGGLLNIARTNITNGDVQCNGNGLVVKSQATQVGVPLTVVPSVTVGQPTMTAPPR